MGHVLLGDPAVRLPIQRLWRAPPGHVARAPTVDEWEAAILAALADPDALPRIAARYGVTPRALDERARRYQAAGRATISR